jgi:asparagine N-glycosylation enzyme membrane subunit Stt3
MCYVCSLSTTSYVSSSTDFLLSVFVLPFGLLRDLKKRQQIGLVGIFALGLITITISLVRFLVYIVSAYSVDDASGSKCEDIP